jgi:regulator of sigma E protease
MEDLLRTVVTVALFLLILGSLVLVHEIGHFVTARMANVRVLEFGVGFPPRARILRSMGETLYTLNWLPIGGFVKLEGEDGENPDDPRSFAAARLPVRLFILAAGVIMNLLTAFLIFTLIAWLWTPYTGLKFSEVDPNSPAEAAGLQPGDTLLAVNGQQHEFFGQGSILTELQANVGQTVTLTVQHADGSIETADATLRTQSEIDASKDAEGIAQKGPLGISGGESGFQPVFYGNHERGLGDALVIAAQQTIYWFGLILAGLGELVSGFINNPTAAPPVAGPVGIATQIGEIFFTAGPVLTLYVAAVLSANLALVNSLPFPPLDGGRALMLVLKRIFGARISLRAERLTYVVGFVVLFAFLIWVTGFDILRVLTGSPT